jgi:hypothetical protein
VDSKTQEDYGYRTQESPHSGTLSPTFSWAQRHIT